MYLTKCNIDFKELYCKSGETFYSTSALDYDFSGTM